jgi:hypothetical protein
MHETASGQAPRGCRGSSGGAVKMWTAHIVCSGTAAATITSIASAPHFTISFCTNGILFMTDSVSYFIGREDLYKYALPCKERAPDRSKEAVPAPGAQGTQGTQGAAPQRLTAPIEAGVSRTVPAGPRPITFSIMGGHTRRVLDIGLAGVLITATEANGAGRIRSMPWGPAGHAEGGAEGLVCDADVLISGGAHQPKPASDFLLRTLKYIEVRDTVWGMKHELPLAIPAKITADTLNIELTGGRGGIVLTIGGTHQPGAEWSGPEFRYGGTISLSRLRELVKLAAGGTPIVGVVPPVGDFLPIWYARVPGYGRLLMIL